MQENAGLERHFDKVTDSADPESKTSKECQSLVRVVAFLIPDSELIGLAIVIHVRAGHLDLESAQFSTRLGAGRSESQSVLMAQICMDCPIDRVVLPVELREERQTSCGAYYTTDVTKFMSTSPGHRL